MTSADSRRRIRWPGVRLLGLVVMLGVVAGACSTSEPDVDSKSQSNTSAGSVKDSDSEPSGDEALGGSVDASTSDSVATLEVTGPATTLGQTGPTTDPPAASTGGPSSTTTAKPSSSGSSSTDSAASTPAAAPATKPSTGTTAKTTPRPRPSGGQKAQAGDPNDAFGGGGQSSCSVFPADNWWNTKVSSTAVHERSADWVTNLGSANLHPDFGTVWDGKAIGIPFVIVDGSQKRVPVQFTYSSESEPGPYPIPTDAPIEDGSDRHVLVIDESTCTLYELFDAKTGDSGASWQAGSGAVFDLGSNGLRPPGWTSADAAGLPIYPGLVTYEEVVLEGRIDHALRFTASRTQRAYISPATHWASSITDPAVAPLGARFRLKNEFDCGSMSAEVQVICAALKTYGMFLADNGADWHVSGAPDPRWNDQALADLRKIPGSAFEVVETGEPLVR